MPKNQGTKNSRQIFGYLIVPRKIFLRLLEIDLKAKKKFFFRKFGQLRSLKSHLMPVSLLLRDMIITTDSYKFLTPAFVVIIDLASAFCHSLKNSKR